MRQIAKVLRDIWATRGRVAFMILSLAAGLTSMGAVLSARTVLQREMTRDYLDTVPASVTFDVGELGFSVERLDALRRRPEVEWAERRSRRSGRWRHPGDEAWGRAMIFIGEEFESQRIAVMEHERGQRGPSAGRVLVERSAVEILGVSVGDHLELETAGGIVVDVEIAGIVHDPALAPAATERAGYFFIDLDTLESLGETVALDEVRVLVADDPLDLDAVMAQVESLAAWFSDEGIKVHEARVPPPGQHPHQAPSETVLLLFTCFAGLTVLLASILCASLLSITMARQVREIAVMKTLGATTGQIVRLYVLMLGIIAAGALLVSVVPTWMLGRLAVDAISNLLNFDIESYRVPIWAIGFQIATGVVLPLFAAAPAIVRASRMTVRAAMDEHGGSAPPTGMEPLVQRVGSRLVQVALLNALRGRRRLALTLALLAAGGGFFVTAISMADSWDAMCDQVLTTRHYDVEMRTAEPVSMATIAPIELRQGEILEPCKGIH